MRLLLTFALALALSSAYVIVLSGAIVYFGGN